MSSLRWLATSERERQQAMELARALQQKESRDELGIGSIRDAIADQLFPGTSTLHTRARYHLFIPWAYQRALQRTGKKSLAGRVRDAEAALIAGFDRSVDSHGLLGRDRGAALQRMPSTLYWQGLYVWGVRRIPGPQSVVERIIERRPGAAMRDDDGDPLDGSALAIWHTGLPRPPDGHPEGATFDLSYREAEFLAERLRVEPATRSSMLATLSAVPVDHRAVDQAWDPTYQRILTASQREVVEQGRRFSLLMHGAAWIYNVILAEMYEWPDKIDEHRGSFAKWVGRLAEHGAALEDWDLDELWGVTRRSGAAIPPPTRRFVTNWLDVVRRYEPASLLDREDVRSLIIERERRTKVANARTANERALKQWGGASGTHALDFRWTVARGLLADIRKGLERNDAAH